MTWILWALGSLAWANSLPGRDEFGRECRLDLRKLAVEVEGEWFDRASEDHFEPVSRPNEVGGGVRYALLKSRADGATAEVFISYRSTYKPVYFELRLPSATGYAHTCRLF